MAAFLQLLILEGGVELIVVELMSELMRLVMCGKKDDELLVGVLSQLPGSRVKGSLLFVLVKWVKGSLGH